jgi:hypothetical protein
MLMALALLLAAPPADYAGAAACATCHRAEFEAQTASAHARTLARSKPPQPGDWAFGAGEQAITFVRRLDPEHYLEEGRSWYRVLDGFAATPGARGAEGTRYRIFDPAGDILRCFSCHSTGPITLAADEAITPHELGVRCEACHGPAAAHARDPARVRPKNPAQLTAGRLNELCGACHRMPVAGKDSLDIQDPWNARHQPPLLAASACFRKSGGRLTCLTCHSPHAAMERKPAPYDAVCGRCHGDPKHSQPVARRSCVGCHMPAVRPNAWLTFSNHRIAIYSPSDPLVPVSVSR